MMTQSRIRELREEYAIHHDVETSDVMVLAEYDEDEIASIKLSLDRDGKSTGWDERIER